MKRGTITINSSHVAIDGDVWMADFEIAELFGVTLSAVTSTIKSIFKSGVLRECDTSCYIRLENDNRADVYNIDIIIALAFRLNSLPATTFRKWVIKKIVAPNSSTPSIVLQLSGDSFFS